MNRQLPQNISIAVICGGPSHERDVSIRSARQVVQHLPEKYAVTIVEIQADGRWLLTDRREARTLPGDRANGNALKLSNGKHATSLTRLNQGPVAPFRVAETFSAAFLVTHGQFGEDGHLQAILDVAGIPYTGSGVLASALAMDKAMTKQFLSGVGVESARGLVIRRGTSSADDKRRICKTVGFPCVVKPNQSGSSLGVSIVQKEAQLQDALAAAFAAGEEKILVEEYIQGRELTCGVLGNSGDQDLTALPLVEILPKNQFFDYNAKYAEGQADEICPARLDEETTRNVQELALTVHRELGCDGLTRSDFILTDDGSVYFLEINTLPGMTESSLCPKEAKAAGMTFSEFLDKQIELAMRKHRQRAA